MIKHITIISSNYYPEDSAIGLYSKQMVDHLIDRDFEVSVLTGFPYYPQWEISKEYKSKPKIFKENCDGAIVYRYRQYTPKNPTFTKRILQILDFTFGALINLFKIKKSDLVIAVVPYTSSIIIGYILKLRLKSKLWIHVQDFEFDAAIQSGVGNDKWYFKGLFWVERKLFSKSDMSSTISASMVEKLKLKGGKNQ